MFLLVLPGLLLLYVRKGVPGEYYAYEGFSSSWWRRLLTPSGHWGPRHIALANESIMCEQQREERWLVLAVFIPAWLTGFVAAFEPTSGDGCVGQFAVILVIHSLFSIVPPILQLQRCQFTGLLTGATHGLLAVFAALLTAAYSQTVTVTGAPVAIGLFIGLLVLQCIVDVVMWFIELQAAENNTGDTAFAWHDNEPSRRKSQPPMPSTTSLAPTAIAPSPFDKPDDLHGSSDLLRAPLPLQLNDTEANSIVDPFSALAASPSRSSIPPLPQKAATSESSISLNDLDDDDDPFAVIAPLPVPGKKTVPAGVKVEVSPSLAPSKSKGSFSSAVNPSDLGDPFGEAEQESPKPSAPRKALSSALSAVKKTVKKFGQAVLPSSLKPTEVATTTMIPTTNDSDDILNAILADAPARTGSAVLSADPSVRVNPMQAAGLTAGGFSAHGKVPAPNEPSVDDKLSHLIKRTVAARAAADEENESPDKEYVVVYRIESNVLARQPAKEFGTFFNGDSYVVVRHQMVGADHPPESEYEMFIWIGKSSTRDEIQGIVDCTVAKDERYPSEIHPNVGFGGYRVHRLCEGFESSQFLSLFPGTSVRVIEGGIDSRRVLRGSEAVSRARSLNAVDNDCTGAGHGGVD